MKYSLVKGTYLIDGEAHIYRQKKAAMNKIKQIVIDSGIYTKK